MSDAANHGNGALGLRDDRPGLLGESCASLGQRNVPFVALQQLDAKILFQPQFSVLDQVPTLFVGPETMRVYDYETAWRALVDPEPASYRRFETVCARWDNSPRTGANAVVLHRSTPEGYGEWLTTAISRVLGEPEDQRLVFLNAWNEWAEGCHLEPDQLYGRGYLEATRRALHGAGGTAPHGPASEEEAAAGVAGTPLRTSSESR